MKNKNVAFHQQTVAVNTTAQELLPVNSYRTYLLIQNNGNGSIYINFTGTATVANGIKIDAEEAYEPAAVPSNAISIISDGSASVIVVEA